MEQQQRDKRADADARKGPGTAAMAQGAAADGEVLPTELCCEQPDDRREEQKALMQEELQRDWNDTADPKLPPKLVCPGVGYQSDDTT